MAIVKQRTCYLTTVDNPYDPETQWREWLMYDMIRYNSCAYLDRIAHISDAMSEEEIASEIERGIDEIVKYNPMLYKKIVKDVDYDTDWDDLPDY